MSRHGDDRGENRDDVPSIREIAEFTRRLRALSATGRDADPDERAAFLAEKNALIARIEAANHRAETAHQAPANGGPPADQRAAAEEDDTGDDAGQDAGQDWSR